jgi:cytochrome c oxidase cbb3-type subunit 3
MSETPEKPEVDEHTGVETTGHEWDGIKELNNPLPRWWLIVFYACCAWAVGYWILMPAWPGITGYTKGIRGESDRVQVAKQIAVLDAQRATYEKQLLGSSLEQIQANPKLLNFAIEAGHSAFENNCAPCHGTGAQGSKGYPNLNDDDWLWGGTLEDIRHTITVGVRSTDPNTRNNQMPAFGRDGLLNNAQISDLMEYVVSLSGRKADKAAAARGASLFQQNCVSCHGPDGKGSQALGAPNLTDNIWLYGGTRADIRNTIYYAHRGVMPTWGGKLSPATIDALAIYVHSLGGGE